MIFQGKSTLDSRQSAVLHPEIQSPFPRSEESCKPTSVENNVRPATMSHTRPRASQLKARPIVVKDCSLVHDLSAHSIPCKRDGRPPRSAPAPTNMTFLPSAQEKLKSSRKLLAKVVGFDARVFQAQAQYQGVISSGSCNPSTDESDLKVASARFNNAFSSRRSPRRLSTESGNELSRLEILRGQGLPATPRLLRGGDSKKYGVRREISSENQLELSPDVFPERSDTKSIGRFSTPTNDASLSQVKMDLTIKSSEEPLSSAAEQNSRTPVYVTPMGNDVTAIAVTNGLIGRDRERDVPWVYCYKVKRDRMKLSRLLSNKSVMDPAIDEMLPAF